MALSIRNTKVPNVLITLAFPLGMWILMEVITSLFYDTHVFLSMLDIKNYVRSAGITACTALALSVQITSGRFDLSLGAQRMLSTILGGNLALRMGMGGISVLLFAIVFGIIFGSLVGYLFITLRVPPMVLGIGVGMVYECIAFLSSDSEGLQLYGQPNVGILSEISFVIIVVLAATIIVMILLSFTKFGYQIRALQGSQAIAKNSGINIYLNVFYAYLIAGALVSLSGVFDAAYKGAMEAELGFTSNAAIFSNAFPVFLGMYLSRWSNRAVGVLVSAFTLKLFNSGLGAMSLSGSATTIINMLLFIGFLVFLANQNVLKVRKQKKLRITQAMNRKAELGLA